MPRRAQQPEAFTLIELLIVVAIIAILAAIAVPNLLQARARALVGREMADLRTLATALEAYAVDHNVYPPHGERLASGVFYVPAARAGLGTIEFVPDWPLTTPIAYLTEVPDDPFLSGEETPPLRRYGYVQSRLMHDILMGRGLVSSAVNIEPRYGGWRLYAAGPDGDKGDAKLSILYDPTNGTISDGDLVRTQKNPVETRSEDER